MNDRSHTMYEALLYLDDEELNKRQRRRLQRHLRTCAACRQRLAAVRSSLRHLQTAARAEPAPRPPAGLHGRIMAAVRADGAVRGNSGYASGQRRLSLAMAGAVLLITGGFVFQGMSDMLKMQRFEESLRRHSRPASSLAAISTLKKRVSARDLSRVRMSLAGEKALLDVIRPYLDSPQHTVKAVIDNAGASFPPALLSRIADRLSGRSTAERGL
ncbi:zf-HC2 domain-containing protein [bacterium]|nr:zf-HC2 domain-containing protein [bacterium]